MISTRFKPKPQMPRKSSYARSRSDGPWRGKRPGRWESRHSNLDYSQGNSTATCRVEPRGSDMSSQTPARESSKAAMGGPAALSVLALAYLNNYGDGQTLQKSDTCFGAFMRLKTCLDQSEDDCSEAIKTFEACVESNP